MTDDDLSAYRSPGALVTVRSSPLHGRGVFALRDIREATLIARAPLLILSAADTRLATRTRIGGYVFWIDEENDEVWRGGVAFGVISLCNHSAPPSARFHVDPDNAHVDLIAARAIGEGEEITIDYERDPENHAFDAAGT